ncbi:MAG: sugar ABC transporter permease [Oscillospiraceae bacterium]|nr:sugar ABC transporter permease [Oscillospiraceae bacterium]
MNATGLGGNANRRYRAGKLEKRNTLIAYTFLAPNFIGFFIFTLIPVAFSIALAFLNWNGGALNTITFAGLENFATLLKRFNFTRNELGVTLKNTAFFTLFTVPLSIACALLLALALNRAVCGAKVFRTIFFFPYIASLVAVCVCWSFMLMKLGPVNQMLELVGISVGKSWTQSREYAIWALIIVSVWRNAGYYMVMYLAGLQGVPAELYEAATVDGANGWHKFWKVTFPMLTPTTFFVSIMMTIYCFKIFDVVQIMTEGGPGRSTKMLVNYIYQLAFIDIKYGQASAVAMALFAIVLIITLAQFRIEKKWVNYM